MRNLTSKAMRIVPAAIAVAALSACDFDRATVLRPLGEPSYDFKLSSDGRNVPTGNVVVSTASKRLTITVSGLEPLASGVYQVWLANVTAGANPGDTATVGSWTKAVGTRKVVRTDTTFTPEGDPVPNPVTVDSTAGVSTFTRGGPATTIIFTIDSVSFAGNPTAFNTVVISLESAAGATTPSAARPLWARGTNSAGTKALLFGNFRADASLQYRFVATGRGTAGIRGNVMIVDDSALARPPIGYYYATWVVKRDANGAPTDTLMLGPQTAPFPDRDVSLREADVDDVHPVVLDFPPSILAASSRLVLSGTNPFVGFEDLWVTLENKLGADDAAAPTIVLSGTVPTIVSEP